MLFVLNVLKSINILFSKLKTVISLFCLSKKEKTGRLIRFLRFSFLEFYHYFGNAGSGVSKDRKLLKKPVYACSTVVLLVLRHWKIWFLVGLEALQWLMVPKLNWVTLETILCVRILPFFDICQLSFSLHDYLTFGICASGWVMCWAIQGQICVCISARTQWCC